VDTIKKILRGLPAVGMCVAIVTAPIPKAEVSLVEVSDDYIAESRRNEPFILDDEPVIVIETETEAETVVVTAVSTESEVVKEPIYPREVFEMSEEDFDNFCRIVYGEANDQSLEGQKAVVEVTANRVLSKHFKDSIIGVLSQRGQYSTWKSRSHYPITQEQIDAIEEVRLATESVLEPYIAKGKANGSVAQEVLPTDYVYFCTPKAYRSIGKKYMANIIQIGGHVFGTFKQLER